MIKAFHKYCDLEPTICFGISAEDRKITLAFELTGYFDGFGDQVEHLFIDGLAVGRNQKEVFCWFTLGPNEQDWWNAAADAADGAGPMGGQLARVHDAQKTFTVYDLAAKGDR